MFTLLSMAIVTLLLAVSIYTKSLSVLTLCLSADYWRVKSILKRNKTCIKVYLFVTPTHVSRSRYQKKIFLYVRPTDPILTAGKSPKVTIHH